MFRIMFFDGDAAYSDGTFHDMYANEQRSKTAAHLRGRIEAGREIKCGPTKDGPMSFASINLDYVVSVVNEESV